jgi:hypothetical protein
VLWQPLSWFAGRIYWVLPFINEFVGWRVGLGCDEKKAAEEGLFD